MSDAEHILYKRKTHPLVAYHYMPRVIGFIFYGLMWISIFYKKMSSPLLAVIAILCLFWPHIAYQIGKRAKNPRKTEYIILHVEALAYGLWTAAIDFRLWPATVLFYGAMVNGLITGGIRFGLKTFFFFSIGVVTGIVVFGFNFVWQSSLFTSVASMTFIGTYSMVTSYWNFFFQEKVSKGNLKVAKINEELKLTRDQLWGEMELAKKIQTTLLPEKLEIEGYTIAAYMQPADEVGGDYYDVINVGNKNWIIIGDVSGHGVPAGLIMMMVQTSIHTVLEDSRDFEPSELLSRVNKVITENIRSLNEDNYMTITVFACIDNGKIYFSGLHQDILIYKKNEDKVIAIPTDGMWLGIMEDIKGFLKNECFTLEPGDTMLVYTDGITEAWDKDSIKNKRNMETDMYSQEKLESLFLKTGMKEPEEIKDIIINSLEDYSCTDDVTLLIAKRNSIP